MATIGILSWIAIGWIAAPVALFVVGLLPTRLLGPRTAVVGALLTLVFAAGLTGDVFSEDAYVSDGSSNWANKPGVSHWIYIGAMTVAAVVAARFTWLARRRAKPSTVRRSLLTSGVAGLFLGYAVAFAFDNN